MIKIKFCNTCACCDKIKEMCLYYGTHIDIAKDFCSKHADSLEFCDICGKPIVTSSFLQQDDEGNWVKICNQCNNLLNTCQLCTCAHVCEFETNPDPMPKTIVKTIQQGNMVMQTQIKNPDRIAKFCYGCPCWMGDGIDACGKEFNIGCCKQNIKISSRKS